MIFQQLQQFATQLPERPLLQDGQSAVTAQEALARTQQIARAMSAFNSQRLYFYAADSIPLVLCLLAADSLGLEVCVLNRALKTREVEGILERLGKDVLIVDTPVVITGCPTCQLNEIFQSSEAGPASETRSSGRSAGIIILTTGTTGLPKAARHSWELLSSGSKARLSEEPHKWLLAYPLNHFAGIQVLLHVLRNGDTLVVPSSRDFEQVVSTVISLAVDSVSATPTFWRMFAGRVTPAQASQMKLRQITLGGEPTNSDLLQKLKSKFPSASITQVYATTELGTCFSVKDGLPGFPVTYLDRQVGNVRLRILDGELYVDSSAKMQGYVDGSAAPETNGDWIATGDIVERVGDRVLFRGRRSEIINVGGVKVHPAKVEEAILRVPGVSAAKAYGRPNPISGQIVACDIELENAELEAEVRDVLHKTCLSQLSRYERPRQLNVVARLERKNEKLVRRA